MYSLKEQVSILISSKTTLLFSIAIILGGLGQLFLSFDLIILCIFFIILGVLCCVGGIINFFD